MTLEEIREVAKHEAAKGAVEALVMTGEAPDVHPKMRAQLNSWGFPTYVDYTYRACEILLEEGLLPHTNIGTLTLEQLAKLKDVNASMGVMLESLSPAVQNGVAHRFAPTKVPAMRMETVRAAGELQIPFTSGILFGIGERREERTQTLEALALLHEVYGHLMEVIVQPLNVQADTPMGDWPEPSTGEILEMVREARSILPDDIHIQIPPNLMPHVLEAVDAGADDLGGLSDEPDLINPNHPWPDIEGLRRHLANHDIDLQLRLPVYDEYIERGWFDPTVGAVMAAFRPALFC
jgi:FO synthase subunit 1